MNSIAISLLPRAKRLSMSEELYLFDNESLALILDARNIRVASLNPLAREALPNIMAIGLDATSEQLAARYGVPASVVRRDLQTFLSDLDRQQLLPGSCSTRGWKTRIATLVLGLLRRWGQLRFPRHDGVNEIFLRPVIARLLRQAWLDLRILGWASTLQAWSVRRNLVRSFSSAEAVNLVDQLVQEEAAGQWFCACACKERALVAAYCLERFFGLPSRIVIGLITVPFQLHAWTACDGKVLTDDPSRIEQFEPLVESTLVD